MSKTKKILDKLDHTCSICFEEYTDDHPNGIKTQIHDDHYGHLNCICDWFRTNNLTCPLCRVDVNANAICEEKEHADQALKKFKKMQVLNEMRMTDFTPKENAEIDRLQETYNKWYNRKTEGGKKRKTEGGKRKRRTKRKTKKHRK